MTVDGFLFVSGPPRSGTTYISDWLSQLPDAYCVHEVFTDLSKQPKADILSALADYARSGADRLDKPRQREFLAWPSVGLQTATPQLLAWKEPVTWGAGGYEAVPEPLHGWLKQCAHSCVMMLRHPFDVVASGRRRAVTTSNWRGLSVEEHCSNWLGAFQLARDLSVSGIPVLTLKWEKLIASPREVADLLLEFTGFPLPPFAGYERSADELELLRNHVDEVRGCTGHPVRRELQRDDVELIRRCLGGVAIRAGYDLAAD